MAISELVAVLDGYSKAALIAGASVVSLISFVVGTTVYRIWFHPLAKIPGPKHYAASDVFGQWRASVRLNMNDHAIKLHRKYGPIVRIGPDRLAVDGNIAWPNIHGARPSRTEAEFSKVPGFFFPNDHMALLAASRDDHRRQRRQLAHAFSTAALQEQEGIIKQYIDKLVNEMRTRAAGGETINMVDWFNYCTFDIIGDLAFADSFHALDGDTTFVKNAFRGIVGSAYGRFLWHFPLLRVPLALILGSREFEIALEANTQNMSLGRLKGQTRISMGGEPRDSSRRDFATYMMRQDKEGNKVLSDGEIMAISGILVIAGSETTATALSGLVFFLGQNPDKRRILENEIRSAFTDDAEIDMTTTARLEYLNAVLEETLRMYPPASSVPPRVSPGAEVAGHWLPRGTILHVYSAASFRNPDHFTDSDSFHPERWLSASHPLYNPRFAADKKEAFRPFSAGPRDCIGKNLAYAKMRVITSRILYNFDLEVLPGQDDWLTKQRGELVQIKGAIEVKPRLRASLKEGGL
ncbi:cytochrome P450 [Microdochium trichocladiopsis]|uniref:Cytochrome P450 n=1 Tax=Microdochium trichocladiopsis TaxID=1682393 RepID=A0A9P8XP23_9PEZI|nr:cytochrome P450 [Microdochium trichocladiopsis]KAH7007967.1 cytochrome P450 [Microdochium trichocladiopsis]